MNLSFSAPTSNETSKTMRSDTTIRENPTSGADKPVSREAALPSADILGPSYAFWQLETEDCAAWLRSQPPLLTHLGQAQPGFYVDQAEALYNTGQPVAEPPQHISLNATPLTGNGSSLAIDTHVSYANQVQGIEYPPADLKIDYGLYGPSDTLMVTNTSNGFRFGIDNATQRPGALVQDFDWSSMDNALAPLDFSGFGANLQMEMPPTSFPSLQAATPAPNQYQPIAPASSQMNLPVHPHYLPGTDIDVGVPIGLQAAQVARIPCTFNGCTRTFRRPGDFRRHLRSHRAPTLRCLVEDCDLKFYRMDKVRDHLRQGHKIVL